MGFNLHVVEHILQKLVPAAGRNSKGPAELIEVLQNLAAVLKAASPCLSPEVEIIMQDLGEAFQNLDDVEDLDLVEKASSALRRMDPQNVSSDHILCPIVNVTAFKVAVRQALEMVESKRMYLSKTRSVNLAHKSLCDINMTDIDLTAVQTFKNLYCRALQYVATVKSKDHPDVKNFKGLIGSLMDKASEGIKNADRLIGRCISEESVDDGTIVGEALCAINGLSKFFETLGFQEADLKEAEGAYGTWRGFKQSCDDRLEIMDIVASFVKKDGVELDLLSKIKFKAADLAVPFDEVALQAIDNCAQHSSLKSNAETGFRDRFDGFVKKYFSGDCKVVPSEDEVLEMLRWAQWSPTPNFARSCVTASRTNTFFTKHCEDIVAVCKKREIKKKKETCAPQ